MFNFSTEYQYLIILTLVLLVPKLLIRLHIPKGISALALGCITANFLGWFENDQTILTLARLGITSLFLFAGMEIELEDLKKNIRPLGKYITKSVVIMLVASALISQVTALSFQISLIISVSIFTPSAGFILSSLKYYDLTDEEVYWTKLKAISKELAAIIVLFIALQLDDLESLFKVKLVFIGLFFLLPPLFKLYLRFLAPYAPKTEVSFLVIVAFLTGVLTKKLGTHYLVGAFITGFVAGQFNHFMKSDHSKRIEYSLTAFYDIFIPFYFFSAGMLITSEFFTKEGLFYGLILIAIFLPLRVFSVFASIKLFIKNFWDDRIKISVALAPNLIFGMVVVGILKERFNLDTHYLSGLVLYTLAVSILPAIYFQRMPPEDYDLSRN